MPVQAQLGISRTVSVSATDGELYGAAPDYNVAQGVSYGTLVSNNSIRVGQTKIGSDYYVFRGFPYFDTSLVPDDATISNVTLNLYVFNNANTSDFNVTVQTGAGVYPSDVLSTYDYGESHYSGGTTNRSVSTITVGAYWSIVFNAADYGLVNKTGVTKLCLRSSEDIAASAPTGNEYLDFYSAEQGSTFSSYLTVTYTTGSEYQYVFHGPFWENGTAYLGLVNVTFASYATSPQVFSLPNGTAAETYSIVSEQVGIALTWNISDAVNNLTRSLYFNGDHFEEFYLFVTQSEATTVQYTFYVNDLAGVTNASLSTIVSANSTTFTAEKHVLTTTGYTTFYLAKGWTYSWRVDCDKGSYTWSPQTADSGASQVQYLYLTQALFGAAASTATVSCTATRLNDSAIVTVYSDGLLATLTANLTVSHVLSNGTWLTDYTVLYSNNSWSNTWNGADNSTDYTIQVVADRTSTDLTFTLQANHIVTGGVWSMMDSIWPDSPIPMSQFFGFGFVAIIFGLFSYATLVAGCFLGTLSAAVMYLMGWLYGVTMGASIAAGFTITFMIAIAQAKMREREI